MTAENPTPSTGAAIWERVIQFREALSPTAARAILKLQFSPHDHGRMRELSAKARAGCLSSTEQIQADTYETLGCLLDIIHSAARRALKKGKSVS